MVAALDDGRGRRGAARAVRAPAGPGCATAFAGGRVPDRPLRGVALPLGDARRGLLGDGLLAGRARDPGRPGHVLRPGRLARRARGMSGSRSPPPTSGSTRRSPGWPDGRWRGPDVAGVRPIEPSTGAGCDLSSASTAAAQRGQWALVGRASVTTAASPRSSRARTYARAATSRLPARLATIDAVIEHFALPRERLASWADPSVALSRCGTPAAPGPRVVSSTGPYGRCSTSRRHAAPAAHGRAVPGRRLGAGRATSPGTKPMSRKMVADGCPRALRASGSISCVPTAVTRRFRTARVPGGARHPDPGRTRCWQ